MIKWDRNKSAKHAEFVGTTLQQIYNLYAIILVPIMAVVLVLNELEYIQVDITQKAIEIYAIIMLLVITLITKLQLFKEKFVIVHYVFLSGVMLLSISTFYMQNTGEGHLSLFAAFSLLGVCMINPKATLIFFIGAFLVYIFLGIYYNNLTVELVTNLIIAASVITVYNYWRNGLYIDLQDSGRTFKGIFDSSNQQIYVLSKDFSILDLSVAAENYLKENGVVEIVNQKFNEVFMPQSIQCVEDFKRAFSESTNERPAFFKANCAVGKSEIYVAKDFTVRRGEYFNEQVFIVNVQIRVSEEREKELIAHKDNVNQILENISYFVFNITFDQRERFKHHVNFVSNKVEEVYGYTVDEYISLVKAEKIDKDRHEEDKERINKEFEVLLKKGGKSSWRFRMLVDGKWRWMEEKLSIERGEKEGIVSSFGMVKDVTVEIEAEQKLIESEKRYRQIFETNLAGVYKTSISGKILACNLAFAKILGFDTVEEILSINVQDVYLDSGERKVYIKELQTKRSLNNYTSILKRKDGRRLIVNNNVSLLSDEESGSDVIVGTVIDVTDLHETSLALKHSEEKYRLLFEESNTAILLLMLNAEENYMVDLNQMSSELFGITEKDFIGIKLEDILVEPAVFESEKARIVQDLKKGLTVEREWQFKGTNNSSFYAEVSFAPVVLDEENVVQLIIKDISDRKQYEKEILESRLSFKNIVDGSPTNILIFSGNELAYVNPNGENLYLNVLNSTERNLFKVFPPEKHHLIRDLIREAEDEINSYTEIELGTGDQLKRYSINVVNTTYNFEKAHLFILDDITLQTEYNIQKLRAEMAEDSNFSLQEEIRKHKRTQLSLIESTSRLKALFESAAHLYIVSIDKNFNLVSFNKNFVRLVKEELKKDVAVGVNFLELFPVEEYGRKIIVERMNRVLGGAPLNMVSNFKGESGAIWMESFMNPIIIDDQDISEISFISRNITEQIENRRRILRSEENNRALLLAVPDVLFKANKDGYFTDYRTSSESEKKAFRMFFKTDEVVNQLIEDVWVDAEVAKQIIENVAKALSTDEVVSHNFSVRFGEGGNAEKIHYENRYTKINEGEVLIISRNVTSTIEHEEKLIESVKEKEILLKEVHHRVKNNLQVINSILNLQSSYVTDEQTLQIIVESQNRIRSMSYIHESLYQTKDFSSLNFSAYISNLVQNLVHSYEVYSDKTELDLKVEEVELALDQAIPCGLILNELITNALKYAYPGKEGGKIKIKVFEENNKVSISVKDYGVGLPKNFNISDTDSLGLSLVDTLIDQLDGQLILKTEGGTEFLIIFEKQEI